MILSKDVILTPEQIAAEERRWLFDAPIAELAEVKGVTVDEAVKLRTDAILQEAAVPIEVTVRPIEPQGKLIGFASVNYGGVVIDDFKVVDGKNGIFLGLPANPIPPAGRATAPRCGSMTGPPGAAQCGGSPGVPFSGGKAHRPGRGSPPHPDQGADGTGRKGGREGKCRPNRPGKEKGGPG